jgi:hypothetical protein
MVNEPSDSGIIFIANSDPGPQGSGSTARPLWNGNILCFKMGQNYGLKSDAFLFYRLYALMFPLTGRE